MDQPLDRNKAYTTSRGDIAGLIPPGARRILDVGCSNGALGAGLLADVPERSVFGIEIDPAFAAEAGTRLSGVLCANVNDLRWDEVFPEAQFDCIVFADVLEHLVDPRRQLLGAMGRLAKGGCLVIGLPNVRHLSAFTSIFLRGTFPARDRGLFDRTHLHWFTIADARALLADCGLQVESIDFAMRLGDKGGGRANRLLNRLPATLRRLGPLREFFTYQFCLRAVADHE